jgi:hypothetical protein
MKGPAAKSSEMEWELRWWEQGSTREATLLRRGLEWAW